MRRRFDMNMIKLLEYTAKELRIIDILALTCMYSTTDS